MVVNDGSDLKCMENLRGDLPIYKEIEEICKLAGASVLQISLAVLASAAILLFF